MGRDRSRSRDRDSQEPEERGGGRGGGSGPLGKRIYWLNTHGGFENAISFKKVQDAASQAGTATSVIMEILKNLEERGQQQTIENPTGWICKAISQGGPGSGGQRRERRNKGQSNRGRGRGKKDEDQEWQEEDEEEGDADEEQKEDDNRRPGDWDCPECGMLVFARHDTCPDCSGLGSAFRKRVHWLNTKGEFYNNQIDVQEVVNAATDTGLDAQVVLDLLDKMVDANNRNRIKQPTKWIVNALNKIVENEDRQREAPERRDRSRSPRRSAPDAEEGRGTQEVREGDWNCSECGFLVFSWKSECPKCNTSSQGDGQDLNHIGLKKRINWLNTKGGFENGINLDDVMREAERHRASTKVVMDILDRLVDRDSKNRVEKPTGWVCKAILTESRKNNNDAGNDRGREPPPPRRQPQAPANNSRGGSNQARGSGSSHSGLSLDIDKLIRRSVGWLNDEKGYSRPIVLDKILESASDLSEETVSKVFEELHNAKSRINDPTAWLCKALDSQKPKSHPEEQLDRAVDALIRKSVAWLNSDGGFANTVLYREVARAAVGKSEREVASVFERMMKSDEKIENPTDYLVRALRSSKPPWR
eukprot:TRINITY_DN91948_c0_g1_i1.p1 TRINITY_DN91948_c0_g1~~TRINITY_DN91948_c0_g1_i1.p1  ORF type:complete len:602 (+),score=109.74 TRINITY_DN91948_c0_g1_i1:35-1807(+)